MSQRTKDVLFWTFQILFWTWVYWEASRQNSPSPPGSLYVPPPPRSAEYREGWAAGDAQTSEYGHDNWADPPREWSEEKKEGYEDARHGDDPPLRDPEERHSGY